MTTTHDAITSGHMSRGRIHTDATLKELSC